MCTFPEEMLRGRLAINATCQTKRVTTSSMSETNQPKVRRASVCTVTVYSKHTHVTRTTSRFMLTRLLVLCAMMGNVPCRDTPSRSMGPHGTMHCPLVDLKQTQRGSSKNQTQVREIGFWQLY
jgi:hypothetical protein